MKYINFADPPSKQAADINENFSVVESGSGGVKTVPAPVIAITDPADHENIQAAFDALVGALKASGVLT